MAIPSVARENLLSKQVDLSVESSMVALRFVLFFSPLIPDEEFYIASDGILAYVLRFE